MKKLVFLLIVAAALAGTVFAWNAVRPPGDFTLATALAECSAHEGVVTQPTVLVAAVPVTAELPSFQAVMARYTDAETAMQPQHNGGIPVINTGQFVAVSVTGTDYYMRC